MATHEYWQFAFVKDAPDDTKALPRLGYSAPLVVETSNMPTGSTLADKPVGRTASDVYAEGSSTTSGNHIRVYWAYPKDFGAYQLTGGVKILRKTKEFPRSHQDTQAETIVNISASGITTRDEYTLFLDNDLNLSSTIFYYTVFYELQLDGGISEWAFSPINGHDRGFALDADSERYGKLLYDYFPRGIRLKDYTEGDEALLKLCKIIGRAFDEASDRLDLFQETRHLPDKVDAALLPYIDHLLGWPTNFELSEKSRREETGNVLDLWRSKGTTQSLKLALQETLGWDINFHYGYEYTLTTATVEDALDPSNPPAGWDEGEDGDWSVLVSSRPFNGTMSTSDTYTPDSEGSSVRTIYSNTGWRNLYGLLIELVSPVVSSALSSALARDKIMRIMPYLAMHYVNYNIKVVENYSEVLELSTTDNHTDTQSNS